jgi:hypothetical protein
MIALFSIVGNMLMWLQSKLLELHHSLPDVPSVFHHTEEVSFPKRCFVVLQECAKLAYINVFDGCGFVGVALTLPLF